MNKLITLRKFTMSMISIVLLGYSCSTTEDGLNEGQQNAFRFVDEYVLPSGTTISGTTFGGISGIDYDNGEWYLLSDDPENARFYTASFDYNSNGVNAINIDSVVRLRDIDGDLFNTGNTDPEALRVFDEGIVWASEGNIEKGMDPSIRVMDLEGQFVQQIQLAEKFRAQGASSGVGPRHNGVFESISLSADGQGFWAATELPLQQDGPEPRIDDTDSPVRVAYVDKETGRFGREFAYELDSVARASLVVLNGVVEILAYDEHKFLFVERSFAAGYNDGGFNIKIYDVDASQATDISAIQALEDNLDYVVAEKRLLFDLDDIRNRLTNRSVDNIEAIAFGPNFANGNRSVILVSDDNFSSLFPQLNQFLLFEWVN